MQPTEAATKSPIDLLMANPGKFSFFSQTLKGPDLIPFSNNYQVYLPVYFSTRPLQAIILSFSSSRSGL